MNLVKEIDDEKVNIEDNQEEDFLQTMKQGKI
jgi:hypothetical protein